MDAICVVCVCEPTGAAFDCCLASSIVCVVCVVSHGTARRAQRVKCKNLETHTGGKYRLPAPRLGLRANRVRVPPMPQRPKPHVVEWSPLNSNTRQNHLLEPRFRSPVGARGAGGGFLFASKNITY